MAKAKPCPFCGNPDVMAKDGDNYVICGKCGAYGPSGKRDPSITKRMANGTKAWNKRHKSEPTPDENAAEAGTMRMLREEAQTMGFADALDALETLSLAVRGYDMLREGAYRMGCRPLENNACATCALLWKLEKLKEAKDA